MRHTTRQYAEALMLALEGQAKNNLGGVVSGFMKTLAKNGDLSKRNQILGEFQRNYFKKNDIYSAEVEMAGAVPETLAGQLERALGGEVVMTAINAPDILGGVKITVNDEILIDASLRAQMNKMFARA